MTDLHTHCLPSIDDGAKDLEESIALLRDSFAQGVALCAATPHCVLRGQEDLETFLNRREGSFRLMMDAAQREGSPIPAVILGAEVYLDHDINRYEGVERLCMEDSSAMLLEFPVEKYNPQYAEWIDSLCLKGIVPVIAHVDRYDWRERLFADLSGVNAAYQINASRFLDFSGRRLVKNLLKKDLFFFVSSDMHRLKARPCNMRKAFLEARKRYQDSADSLFDANARRLLERGESHTGLKRFD